MRARNRFRNGVVAPVDALLMIWVVGGLATQMLSASWVATVVEPSAWSHTHQGAVLVGTACAVTVLVARCATVWGPVRVDPATARWTMSGPQSRTRVLLGRLGSASAVAVGAALAVHGVVALLVPSAAAGVLLLGAASGIVAVGAAYLAQLRRDSRVGAGAKRWSVSPGRLHRTTFAPRDGFAGAVGLAASMMDASWIADARVTRWQRQRTAAPTASAPGTPPLSPGPAFVRLDARRLRRHPEMIVRWCCWTVVAVGCPLLLVFHHLSLLVPAIAVWSAGTATGGGLAAVTNPVLRRAFPVADRRIILWHCVIPGLATAASATAASVAAGATPLAAAVLIVGSVVAVLRRATRPPLPFDAPVVIDSLVTGAAFQPGLLTVQLRGLLAAIVTGVLAGAVL